MAVPIVGVYLALNLVIVTWGLHYLILRPELLGQWRWQALLEYGSTLKMMVVGISIFSRIFLSSRCTSCHDETQRGHLKT